MSKKELVSNIKDLLKNLNIDKNGCANIYSLSNVSWVGYTQVLKRKNIGGSLYRNYRRKLYSKYVSLDELLAIYNELSERLDNKKREG